MKKNPLTNIKDEQNSVNKYEREDCFVETDFILWYVKYFY